MFRLRQVTDLLIELQQTEGLVFLFISHDMAVVERVSRWIAVMLAGEIVETGPTNEVLRNPRHAYPRRLLAAAPKPDPGMKGAARESAPRPNQSIVRQVGEARPELPRLEMAPGHFVRADAA